MKFNSTYSSMDVLGNKAMGRIPKFAFEYLDGGYNEDVSISRNTSEIRGVQSQPRYLRNDGICSTKANILLDMMPLTASHQ